MKNAIIAVLLCLALANVAWADSPAPRTFNSMTSFSEGILMYGGIGQDSTVLGDSWLLQYVDMIWVWSRLSEISTPGKLYGIKIFTRSSTDTVYLFGGEDDQGALHNELWRYDQSTLEWILVSDNASSKPTPRKHAACWITDDELYILGGEDDVDFLQDYWKFNFSTMLWER